MMDAVTNTEGPRLDKILKGWGEMMMRGSVDLEDLPFIAPKLLEAATLLAQVEELRRERDDARRLAVQQYDRATAAEALVAEGVKICEPLLAAANAYTNNSDPDEFIDWGITIGECRAARSFIQCAKESRT